MRLNAYFNFFQGNPVCFISGLKPVIGFSQTHVSGTGGESKYGNFRITPQTGTVNPKDLSSPKSDEQAEAGYYTVVLTKPNVRAELTTTRLVAAHRYTFPKTPDRIFITSAARYSPVLKLIWETEKLLLSKLLTSQSKTNTFNRQRSTANLLTARG